MRDLDRLTEPQRECLRLVSQGYESKEIARQLGITFYAVDTRLARAVQTLGVRGRREAARLLEASERAMSERAVYGSAYDDPTDQRVILAPEKDRTDETPASKQYPELTQSSAPLRRAFRWPIPTAGRRTNDLNLAAVLFWVGTGAFAIGLIAIGLVAIALTAHDQVSRLFQH